MYALVGGIVGDYKPICETSWVIVYLCVKRLWWLYILCMRRPGRLYNLIDGEVVRLPSPNPTAAIHQSDSPREPLFPWTYSFQI